MSYVKSTSTRISTHRSKTIRALFVIGKLSFAPCDICTQARILICVNTYTLKLLTTLLLRNFQILIIKIIIVSKAFDHLSWHVLLLFYFLLSMESNNKFLLLCTAMKCFFIFRLVLTPPAKSRCAQVFDIRTLFSHVFFYSVIQMKKSPTTLKTVLCSLLIRWIQVTLVQALFIKVPNISYR